MPDQRPSATPLSVTISEWADGPTNSSTAHYCPFGDWRTEPTASDLNESPLTDRGFTGHKSNNLGTGAEDIGLIYMQARYYLPGRR